MYEEYQEVYLSTLASQRQSRGCRQISTEVQFYEAFSPLSTPRSSCNRLLWFCTSAWGSPAAAPGPPWPVHCWAPPRRQRWPLQPGDTWRSRWSGTGSGPGNKWQLIMWQYNSDKTYVSPLHDFNDFTRGICSSRTRFTCLFVKSDLWFLDCRSTDRV